MIKTYYISSTNIPKLKPNASCIGNFDASHRGHQALYRKTISIAHKNKLKAYLITFDKDPNTILFNEKPLYSLNTRIKLYESYGFDGVIIIKTNKNFYSLSPISFINKYLLKLNIEYLVSGFDFRFGKNQKGNNKLLKKYFNKVFVVKPVKYKNKKISTKYIKEMIKKDRITEVNIMLGYEFKK